MQTGPEVGRSRAREGGFVGTLYYYATRHFDQRTVRPTERTQSADSGPRRRAYLGRFAVCCLIGAALAGVAGCSNSKLAGDPPGTGDGSVGASGQPAAAAGGVRVSQEALKTAPKPWVLTTPESAVRSYLAWTSYAYRIGKSSVAVPTMGSREEVRVDSYIQNNIEQSRLIDQTLQSIEFGKPTVKNGGVLVPAQETWTYRYVSTTDAGRTVSGPFSASYETTYTVVKSEKGVWVVDSVAARPYGTVK